MREFELDKRRVADLYDLWKKNRLDTQPEWQRSEVWPDRMKFDLIDTILNNWPMGLVMLNVVEHVDADNQPVEYFEVVDGQQRVTTLFAYKDGAAWTKSASARNPDFLPFGQLTTARQERFDDYRVAVALMKGYEQDEILDIYSRFKTASH